MFVWSAFCIDSSMVTRERFTTKRRVPRQRACGWFGGRSTRTRPKSKIVWPCFTRVWASGHVLNVFRGKIQFLETSTQSPEQLAPILEALLKQPIEPPAYWKPAVEQCVVCMAKAADMLVVPCGHLCGCRECLEQLHNGPCPICRQPIASICKVYHAGLLDDDDAASAAPADDGWAAHDAKQALKSESKSEGPIEVSLAVARCGAGSGGEGETTFAVTVSCPDATERVPVDLCCVVRRDR